MLVARFVRGDYCRLAGQRIYVRQSGAIYRCLIVRCTAQLLRIALRCYFTRGSLKGFQEPIQVAHFEKPVAIDRIAMHDYLSLISPGPHCVRRDAKVIGSVSHRQVLVEFAHCYTAGKKSEQLKGYQRCDALNTSELTMEKPSSLVVLDIK